MITSYDYDLHTGSTPLLRGLQLRQFIGKLNPGDTFLHPPGVFNIGGSPALPFLPPAGITIKPRVPGTVYWTTEEDNTAFFGSPDMPSSAWSHDWPAICLSPGLVIEGIDITHDYSVQNEGELIGWGFDPTSMLGTSSATIRGCNLTFRQWGICNYTGNNIILEGVLGGNTMTGWGHFISNNKTGGASRGMGMQGYNGPGGEGSGFISVSDYNLIGDESRIVSTLAGNIRHGCYLHFFRNAGGTIRANRVTASATGSQYTVGYGTPGTNDSIPAMRFAWIIPNVQGYGWPLGTVVIDLKDCHVRLKPGGCTDCKDIETPALGLIPTYGGSGSGLDANGCWTGAWTR